MNRAKVTAMVAAAALTPLALAMTTAAGAAGVAHQQDQSGAITIQSWLYAVPSENLMSATVWDCFKITGAINDEGGGPTWTDDTSYHAPNTMTSGGVLPSTLSCCATRTSVDRAETPIPTQIAQPASSGVNTSWTSTWVPA